MWTSSIYRVMIVENHGADIRKLTSVEEGTEDLIVWEVTNSSSHFPCRTTGYGREIYHRLRGLEPPWVKLIVQIGEGVGVLKPF